MTFCSRSPCQRSHTANMCAPFVSVTQESPHVGVRRSVIGLNGFSCKDAGEYRYLKQSNKTHTAPNLVSKLSPADKSTKRRKVNSAGVKKNPIKNRTEPSEKPTTDLLTEKVA